MANNSDPITHYIVVRKDLPTGTICAMIAHAAGESYRYRGGTPTVVILAAKDEVHLTKFGDRIAQAGLFHVPIFEFDPPWNGQLMAIGVAPYNKSKVYKMTHDYNMLRFE